MNKSSDQAIIFGSATVIALLLTMAAFVISSDSRMEREATAVQVDSVPGLIDGHTIRSAYSEGFVCAILLDRKADKATREALIGRISRLDDTARLAVEAYSGTIHIDPAADTTNFNAVLHARDVFLKERDGFIRLALAGEGEEAGKTLQERLVPAYDVLMRACDVLVAYNNQTGLTFSSRVVGTVHRMQWITMTLAALAVAAGGFVFANLFRQMRITREMRESEAKFATAFKISPRAMTISRKSDGTIYEANPAFLASLGKSKDEVIGRTTIELGIWKSVEERNQVIELLDRDGIVRDTQFERLRLGGGHRVTLLSIAPLRLRDEDFMLSVSQDITDLVETKDRLSKTVAELKAIFDSSATSMALVDTNARLVRWNAAFEKLLGYSPEELAGMSISDITHPEDVNRGMERFSNQIQGNEDTYQMEKRYVRKDGATIWGRLTTSVVRDKDGGIIYGVGLIDDITAQKRSESALAESESHRQKLQHQLFVSQKLEALGLLAGGVAHDFNNMIAAVLLYLDLIRTEPGLTQECQQTLLEMKGAVKRAAGLTRQLLLFSRNEPAQRSDIDLNSVVEHLLNMLRRLVGSHIELRHRPAATPLWVHADAGMIEQVAMNLVVNARDAMPRGGRIELTLDSIGFDGAAAEAHPSRKAGRFARLVVRDSGTGMSPDVIARIFEPFFTTKSAGKGTGLGLSTALGIVQQHGGWIEVDSVEGQGTSFGVFLPERPEREMSRSTPAAVQRDALEHGGEAILLAEDNDQLRTVSARILRQHGYDVVEASNGVEAREILDSAQRHIDLLLTDVVMPGGVFGHDLAASLRAEGRPVRTIVMSAHNTAIDRDAIERAGGVYLAKPFDTATLLAAVRSTLDGPAAGAAY